jgi:hypothetical protein
MERSGRARRIAGSWLLLALSLVAAAAPAWAAGYVCPMARQSLREHRPSCCVRAEPSAASASGPRLAEACHCPQVGWEAAPAQPREPDAFHGSSPVATGAGPTSLPTVPSASVDPSRAERPPAAAPLWIRNLSIRC